MLLRPARSLVVAGSLVLLLAGVPALSSSSSWGARTGTAALPFFAPASSSLASAAAGSCKSNDQCGEGEFCARLFGRCSETGKCEERPKDCIEHGGKVLIRTVCGCDGKSYDSVCVAAIAGVSVAHEGSCAP